jgi:hypothetical protein
VLLCICCAAVLAGGRTGQRRPEGELMLHNCISSQTLSGRHSLSLLEQGALCLLIPPS